MAGAAEEEEVGVPVLRPPETRSAVFAGGSGHPGLADSCGRSHEELSEAGTRRRDVICA